MSTQSALLKVMSDAARQAARGLNRDFGELAELQVSRKGAADFVSAADGASLSVPVLEGAERLTASSSRGWVNAEGLVSPSAAPWAA